MRGNVHVRFGVGVGVQIPGLHHEIKSCCRLSELLDIPLSEAACNLVPVSITSAKAIKQLRDWASGRCLSADRAGVYQKPKPAQARRTITPSAN